MEHKLTISKETFSKALRLIKEQEDCDEQFSKALQEMGNGHFVFGTNNKCLDALLLVLTEVVQDKHSYISWWLYNTSEDYEVSLSDGSKKWCLKEPEALYDYLMNETKSATE